MLIRIYTDKDGDLTCLKNKTCTVIGFGSQGRAQALNLRDNKLDVIVGLHRKSKSRIVPRRNRLRVFEMAEATRRGDIIFLALADTKMLKIFSREMASHLRSGQTLLFAHGFAIQYRTIVPPKNIDVIMVAPKGLGPMVRREFVEGRGVPALFAVRQNATGQAKKNCTGLGKGNWLRARRCY